ncbi:UDP-N-acetylglucosamine 2-epimerase [Burkholderia stabilis]|uniref:UDP-N-acetylglucosamine 2-epimerase,UDP-N-acetylglucosamine 2-epimerase,UDP-N-acetylglucosamine 2-epimerase,UDP-N-acetylglucosamine 2-epimerase n=1 Tax=Burkholderia stabilis TaxID=95485 RepID=A0AAJ5T3K1_9BURK|nr:UDP-N-acetylglucosamine 2-epimerase (non-hydrolyzing) [Burkholderia stabilis]AOR67447.1 UDP-N-acetylglucosamine 2-epimerase [Burkholderia stabilis]VBB11489.1 UDP-N-acetylglucosamine 2-epimerase,UDP-N-acetylglucosamine 2-epimerase,UDP-N-acetylglucosamine 2-epimerase,UDP-N-acetylglucosamine 2-epimerase [Burkholderia stabilis]HDR9492546.1 UDP-N-acetylglucosamine 2-epimerase (non-hydrolyzing) [Burkholderia stabilis]HDR9523066.1 UDP-N-acetylglucosamine 2-epimerase (non-hydrolyzing) [Burkholderia 
MLKVMTIVGTRPELIKMARVIAEFDKHTNHVLVHTGQNFDFELNQIFFDELGIRKPDYFLEAVGENAAQTIARVIEKSDKVMEQEKPDAVLLYGDTNSCLAVISAKRRKIPVFHMEAGNRCFDQRVPEELNRKVLDHLSDINLVLTEHARRYLIAEGIPQDRIIKSGSHMAEVLEHFKHEIESATALEKLGLEERKYFVVSAHREENVDSEENLRSLVATLDALAAKYGFPVIVSTHPRTQKRMAALDLKPASPLVRYLKPFGFFDYVKLQQKATCVLSDSGTITEESALLNFPAVTIRNSHERPEGMDQGTLVMCGLQADYVLDAVGIVTAQWAEAGDTYRPPADYVAENVSQKILRIVLSYTRFVNQRVWFQF